MRAVTMYRASPARRERSVRPETTRTAAESGAAALAWSSPEGGRRKGEGGVWEPELSPSVGESAGCASLLMNALIVSVYRIRTAQCNARIGSRMIAARPRKPKNEGI